MSKLNYIKASLSDLVDALSRHQFWLALGWFDIKLRYRRSVIGPWWISLSMLIYVSAMSVVYTRLFHQDVKSYLPFLISGFLFWWLIAGSVAESGELLRNSHGYIRQIPLPFMVYILRGLYRQVIILLHNFAVYALLLLFFPDRLSWYLLLAPIGVLLLVLNLFWVSLFLSMVGARFRDVSQIINSLLQVLFMVSPITWMPSLLGEKSKIVLLNPLYYWLDVVRSPLLGQAPHFYSWFICGLFALLGLTFTFIFYGKYSKRIPFWVGC